MAHRFFRTAVVLTALSVSAGALAAPYSVPRPNPDTCTNDQVLQELTDNISSGNLSGEQNLMLSLNFVQSCQDLIYRDRPNPPAP